MADRYTFRVRSGPPVQAWSRNVNRFLGKRDDLSPAQYCYEIREDNRIVRFWPEQLDSVEVETGL